MGCYREALRLKPDYLDAYNNFGVALLAQGRLEEATASFREALRLRPNYAEAYNQFGIALKAQGRLEEAMLSYREALRLKPDYAEAHNNLGNVLREQGRLEEAMGSFREALRLNPRYAEAHNNFGVALGEQAQAEEAVASYRQALRLKPDYAEAHNNLGVALGKLGQLEEAMVSFREALRLKPDYADAHNNLGLCSSGAGAVGRGSGQLPGGLPPQTGFCRCRTTTLPTPSSSWETSIRDGPNTNGAGRPNMFLCPLTHSPCGTVRTWPAGPSSCTAEQGLGDTLQFIRYAPLVKQRGGIVLVKCPKDLTPLLARCPGIDRLLPFDSPLPPFDVHAPLLSLPRILGTSLATVPASGPYLVADEKAD